MTSIPRNRDVNFGDWTPIKGDAKQQLCDVSFEHAQPFTAYVVARVEPPTAKVIPLVTVEWGHGGASLTMREMPVFRRLRIPVVGSSMKLIGRATDAAGGPLADGVVCHMKAFAAPGSDGETLRNTRWIAQRGAGGILSDGPEQVVTVQGYSATAADAWVMLFDAVTAPTGGEFPAMAAPVRQPFRLDRFDSQGFRFGVAWAVSQTPITFTPDPSANVRLDVEVLT